MTSNALVFACLQIPVIICASSTTIPSVFHSSEHLPANGRSHVEPAVYVIDEPCRDYVAQSKTDGHAPQPYIRNTSDPHGLSCGHGTHQNMTSNALVFACLQVSGRDCSRSRPRCPGFDSGPEPPVEGGTFRVVITSSERASVGKQPQFLRGQELPRLPPSVDVLVSGRDCSRSRPRCPGFDSGPEPPVEGGTFRVVITSSERASVGKQPQFLRGQELPRLPPSVDVLVSA
ncbi:hypothetical protein HPB50_009435 [Hyalomma asiaticum]|uniref:Uncharacterized protein n=1 Tax=Hyalomma asiaticum TaxID=266040 RepID=A0ACB7S5Q7_HYAAI|nr:hypothetical protein HPB50_009435 [Hyalomma asiaticum]